MRLTHFRVMNYRSINDSGLIEVRDSTALVGRNESGKSNLLLALQSVRPTGGRTPLSKVKDFPRDRPLKEFSDPLPVVETTWSLNNSERQELASMFPRAKDVTIARVTRRFDTTLTVGFVELPSLGVIAGDFEAAFNKVQQSLVASLRSKPEEASRLVSPSADVLREAIESGRDDLAAWVQRVGRAVEQLRQACVSASLTPAAVAETNLSLIEESLSNLSGDDHAYTSARNWIANRLPIFMYLSDYPELNGHQSLPDLLASLRDNDLDEAEGNFLKLAKVAGLDPAELNSLLDENHEERQQLANRAGAIITSKIRELWTDRELKVRFNLDGEHFDTLVSDPNALYDVEINLDERSRGFKWFFSFYITFAADTGNGPAEGAILLLDEPGLHLHATAQRDLLDHFKDDFENQIVYTTHSPFMIPIDGTCQWE